jgi:glycosyltransferase involved in cell wall biosynthesis
MSTKAPSTAEAVAPRVAVLIPCLNEEAAIGKVVADFRSNLPDADVYVYDNASDDRTSEVAAEAGAIVKKEPQRGKGNVIRRMFADVDSDIYLMVDGDDTYDASSAPVLVEKLLDEQLDMINAARVASAEAAYRQGHRFGNKVLTSLVQWTFGNRIEDMLSGFRVFSRRFVKSFPADASGFEIETELTIHALELRMPIAEVQTPYGIRPENSTSKLSTYRDGIRILLTIVELLKTERPLFFFSIIGLLLALISVGTAIPQVILPWFETGLVERLPTAVLVTGLMLSAIVSFAIGLILDTVTRGRRETKRMHYLTISAPKASGSK